MSASARPPHPLALRPRDAGWLPSALLATLLGACVTAAPLAAAPALDGQTFGDWTVKCEPLPDGQAESCFIFQNRVVRGTSQRVLHVAVGYIPGQDVPVMLFTTPLGVSLPQGVALSLDGTELERAGFQVCEAQGCRAGLRLEAALLERLSAGQELKVSFQDTQRRERALPVSLAGFAEGLAALVP